MPELPETPRKAEKGVEEVDLRQPPWLLVVLVALAVRTVEVEVAVVLGIRLG
jgi:hypothetical protein